MQCAMFRNHMIMEGAVTSIPVGFQTLGPKKAVAPHIAGRRKGRVDIGNQLGMKKTVAHVPWVNRAGAHPILFTYHICNVRWESDYQLYI